MRAQILSAPKKQNPPERVCTWRVVWGGGGCPEDSGSPQASSVHKRNEKEPEEGHLEKGRKQAPMREHEHVDDHEDCENRCGRLKRHHRHCESDGDEHHYDSRTYSPDVHGLSPVSVFLSPGLRLERPDERLVLVREHSERTHHFGKIAREHQVYFVCGGELFHEVHQQYRIEVGQRMPHLLHVEDDVAVLLGESSQDCVLDERNAVGPKGPLAFQDHRTVM